MSDIPSECTDNKSLFQLIQRQFSEGVSPVKVTIHVLSIELILYDPKEATSLTMQ